VSKRKKQEYQKRAAKYVRSIESRPRIDAKLPSGKNFVRLQSRVEKSLEAALRLNEGKVREFFKRFPYVSTAARRKINSFIDRIPNPSVRKSLREYADFALRFNVCFTLEPRSTVFGVEPVNLPSSGLWGKISNRTLVPGSDSGTEVLEFGSFADNAHQPPAKSASLFTSGKAKWFVIDDPRGQSLLADIEAIAYSPDAIVFVTHYPHIHQPFLFCLIGEDVSDDDWKKAAPVKTQFQQEQYGTGIRGRKPNVEQQRLEYKALDSSEPKKNIAASIAERRAAKKGQPATAKQVDSAARQLRRRASELKRH
jgi:hypothetical protein